MAEFRKYMFDDFVIEDLREDFDEDLDNIDEDLGEIKEENVISENVVKEVFVEEKIAISEVQRRVDEASKKAFEQGYKSVTDTILEKNATVLENIEKELKDIIATIDIRSKQIEKDYLFLLKESLKKIVPTVLEDDAQNIVSKFIEDNFDAMKKEPKLSFYVNSEIALMIKSKIEAFLEKNNFEGRVLINVDDNLLASDCKIEWENGGVQRSAQKIIERIDKL